MNCAPWPERSWGVDWEMDEHKQDLIFLWREENQLQIWTRLSEMAIRLGTLNKGQHLWHSYHVLLSPGPMPKVKVKKSYHQNLVNQELHYFPQRHGLNSKWSTKHSNSQVFILRTYNGRANKQNSKQAATGEFIKFREETKDIEKRETWGKINEARS